MALVRRLIETTFVLGEGDFGEQGQDTVKLAGLRVSAQIANAGGHAMGSAAIRIYGMTLSQMNKLSTLGMTVTMTRKNSITISAGNEGSELSTVFQGTIYNAWGEISAMPNVPFHVLSQTGLLDAVRPGQIISLRGSGDVAGMLSGIATQMGVAFENNGISAKIANPYYAGSLRDQALAIVKEAGIEWNGAEKGILAIWKPGESRGGTIPLISKETGMIASPTFTANGISLQTVWNPSIGLGSKIEVRSILTPANRLWVVYKIDHELDSLVPGGQWRSTILAVEPGYYLRPVVP